MKKILLVVLCLALSLSIVGCAKSQEPEKNAEELRADFFDAFQQTIGETQNSEKIKSRIEKYKTQEMKQTDGDERQYSFVCDAGFASPQEAVVVIWTDENGEAKAMACCSLGNEGRPIFEAIVKTLAPDMDVEVLKNELFDFAYMNETDSAIQIGDVTVTKAFNNGGNIVTTGGINAVYSVCKTADLENEEFKDYFDTHRNTLEITVLY